MWLPKKMFLSATIKTNIVLLQLASSIQVSGVATACCLLHNNVVLLPAKNIVVGFCKHSGESQHSHLSRLHYTLITFQ